MALECVRVHTTDVQMKARSKSSKQRRIRNLLKVFRQIFSARCGSRTRFYCVLVGCVDHYTIAADMAYGLTMLHFFKHASYCFFFFSVCSGPAEAIPPQMSMLCAAQSSSSRIVRGAVMNLEIPRPSDTPSYPGGGSGHTPPWTFANCVGLEWDILMRFSPASTQMKDPSNNVMILMAAPPGGSTKMKKNWKKSWKNTLQTWTFIYLSFQIRYERNHKGSLCGSAIPFDPFVPLPAKTWSGKIQHAKRR